MKWGVYDILTLNGLSYCTKCRRVLPRDAFRRDKNKKHGIAYHCKACRDGYVRGSFPAPAQGRERESRYVWIISDLQRILETSDLAYCSKCKRILPRSEFNCDNARTERHRLNRNGLHCHCKTCHNSYHRLKRPTERKRNDPATDALHFGRGNRA